jgi:hypothetical protein
MSDHDEFDEIFRGFDRFVGPVSERSAIDESALADLPQLEGAEGLDVDDELILGTDDVTYLLHAADRELEDFIVSAREEELEVRTPEFTARRALGVRVDPAGARVSYRNGVFSVKLKRRDA